MELVLLYTGAPARVISCEYMVQQYCKKLLSGFSTGVIAAVGLSTKTDIHRNLQWTRMMEIFRQNSARNGMQSSSKNHKQKASRKSLSLRHQKSWDIQIKMKRPCESTLLGHFLP